MHHEDIAIMFLPCRSMGMEPAIPGGKEFVDSTVRYALPGDYLRKVDVMSAAHGLEVPRSLPGRACSRVRGEDPIASKVFAQEK